MATALLVAPPVDRTPVPLARPTKPPRPPHGVTVVFLDEFDVGSELMVELDRSNLMQVSLRANGLDVSGSASATIREFGTGAVFALAEIPVTGFDSLAQRATKGWVNIGLIIGASVPGDHAKAPASTVAASALAEGDWTGGLFRFSKVARHNLQRRTIWLSMPDRQLRDWPRAKDGESTRLRWR